MAETGDQVIVVDPDGLEIGLNHDGAHEPESQFPEFTSQLPGAGSFGRDFRRTLVVMGFDPEVEVCP
jgi:hypothetical protein